MDLLQEIDFTTYDGNSSLDFALATIQSRLHLASKDQRKVIAGFLEHISRSDHHVPEILNSALRNVATAILSPYSHRLAEEWLREQGILPG
jgi:hypothetical protein